MIKNISISIIAGILMMISVFGSPAFAKAGRVTVVFLPFEDKVKLNEAWDLSTDLPRWYSRTIDTVASRDSLIRLVDFDSTALLIKQNGWKSAEYLTPALLARIAAHYHADYIVTGSVRVFKVMKRAVNTDGQLSSNNSFTGNIVGSGGTPVQAGLQSYTAEVKMTLQVYNGQTGELVRTIPLDSEQKDGGIKIWLPVQSAESDEMNFYYVSRTPFGSVYFQRSVIGALMRAFSLVLHNTIVSLSGSAGAASRGSESRDFLQGKIIDRNGTDLYLDLGTADHLMLGDLFEVMKSQRPVRGEKGDTLGWVDQVVGHGKVRAIKSQHFSQAQLIDSTAEISTGLTVRLVSGRGE